MSFKSDDRKVPPNLALTALLSSGISIVSTTTKNRAQSMYGISTISPWMSVKFTKLGKLLESGTLKLSHFGLVTPSFLFNFNRLEIACL